VAGKKKVLLGDHRAWDDTRQDPPWKALAEADFADPGRQGGDDTRQDLPQKADPAHLCGLWIGKGGDTRKNRLLEQRGLSWNRSKRQEGTMESPVVQQIRQLYEVEGLSLRYNLEGQWTP